MSRSNAEGDLPPLLAETVELVESLDRSERIDALIALSDRFREVPEHVARRPFDAAARVPGCESQAYVFAEERVDGTLDFHFAVENPQGLSAKAFATVLADALSGESLERVAAVPASVVERLFGRELSMGKNLGLTGMLQSVQREARRRMAPAVQGRVE